MPLCLCGIRRTAQELVPSFYLVSSGAQTLRLAGLFKQVLLHAEPSLWPQYPFLNIQLMPSISTLDLFSVFIFRSLGMAIYF